MKIFFATDIHGSHTCWRKFLNCSTFYEVDLLILGGDMTGKALVPIVETGANQFRATLQGQVHEFEGVEAFSQYSALIRERGLYPLRCTGEDLERYAGEPQLLDDLFEAEILKTVEEWMTLADARLPSMGVRCVVCPGNDDNHSVDEVLHAASWVEVGEGNVLDLDDGYQLFSTGWANRTPWDTHREEDEPEHRARIDAMVQRATVAPERMIFNFHCPPHNTPLDLAPKLSDDLVVQGKEMAHVGSTAVRNAIEEYKPGLSLHGHIHESRAAIRLGKSLSINPGSDYEQGVLNGCVVQLDGKSKVKRYKLTTG